MRLYGLCWRIEQTLHMLKSGGLRLYEAQSADSDRLMTPAALAAGTAVRIIRLVDTRDPGIRPATDAATAAASRWDRRPCARYATASRNHERIRPGDNSRPLHPDSYSRCMSPVAPGGRGRRSISVGHTHRFDVRQLGVERRPGVPLCDGRPDRLRLLDRHRAGLGGKRRHLPSRRTRRSGRRASWRNGIAG